MPATTSSTPNRSAPWKPVGARSASHASARTGWSTATSPELAVAYEEDYARTLTASGGRTGGRVEVVDGAERPTVRLDFQVGAGGEVAEGTERLVLGPNGIVWSVTVTSDDPDLHDDLASAISDTLTLADG